MIQARALSHPRLPLVSAAVILGHSNRNDAPATFED